MALKISVNAKLYYLDTPPRASWGAEDTDGLAKGPAPDHLQEIANVKDIKQPLEKDKADVTTRKSRYKATKGTLRGISIDIPMEYDTEDDALIALQTAYLTDTTIALAVLDGDATVIGTMGFWADFEVTKMEKDEALADSQMVTFTVEPAWGSVPPEWIQVTA